MTRNSRLHGRGPRGGRKKVVFGAVAVGAGAVDVLRIARAWWRTNRYDVDPHKHVKVTFAQRKTFVEIDHVIPVDTPSGGRWRITTAPQYLPTNWFTLGARKRVDAAAKSGRGRAVYCIDLTRGGGEVIFALSYHIDSNTHVPILITAVAFRTDRSELWGDTRVAGWITTRYLHALARELHRGPDIGFPTDSPALGTDLSCLGFTKVAPPVGRQRRHAHYYNQPDE